MHALATLSVLVALAAGGAARAQELPPSCQTYTRSGAAAPELVRAWLAHSADDHVIVCAAAASEAQGALLYSGESAVAHAEGVCSYSSHGLNPAGSDGKRELRRYDRGDALHMALATTDCPAPHAPAQAYTETYDVSPAAFVAIMQLWSAAAASVQMLEAEIEGHGSDRGDSATGRRLRQAIETGRMKAAPVIRIVRLSGAGLHRRYALFVADPARGPRESTLYVIYLTRWIGGPWHISGVADAAD